MISRKGAPNIKGLGKLRYVVEQTFALLHQFKRLAVRWERRLELHDAFVSLGSSLGGGSRMAETALPRIKVDVPARPVDAKRVHFVGIGGLDMLPLARVYAERGCTVTGSDVRAGRSDGAGHPDVLGPRGRTLAGGRERGRVCRRRP